MYNGLTNRFKTQNLNWRIFKEFQIPVHKQKQENVGDTFRVDLLLCQPGEQNVDQLVDQESNIDLEQFCNILLVELKISKAPKLVADSTQVIITMAELPQDTQGMIITFGENKIWVQQIAELQNNTNGGKPYNKIGEIEEVDAYFWKFD